MAQGQLMPARTEPGWHVIPAGPVLDIMYHPNRQLAGRESDGIRRQTITIAVKELGRRQRRRIQRLRFDPFSEGAHYHVLPREGERPSYFVLQPGQSPLDAALEIVGTRNKLRPMLIQAGASTPTLRHVTRENLKDAADTIRAISRLYDA